MQKRYLQGRLSFEKNAILSFSDRRFEVDLEYGLIGFECHALSDLVVLIEIDPGSISASFVVDSICENPGLLSCVKSYASLLLGE